MRAEKHNFIGKNGINTNWVHFWTSSSPWLFNSKFEPVFMGHVSHWCQDLRKEMHACMFSKSVDFLLFCWSNLVEKCTFDSAFLLYFGWVGMRAEGLKNHTKLWTLKGKTNLNYVILQNATREFLYKILQTKIYLVTAFVLSIK